MASGPFSRIARSSASLSASSRSAGHHPVHQPDPVAPPRRRSSRRSAAARARGPGPPAEAAARCRRSRDRCRASPRAGRTGRVSLAMRRWQAIASSHPPPSAKPLTAATTGLPQRSSRAEHPLPLERPRLAVHRALARDLADVRAGDERLGAGTGEEHAPDRGLAPRSARPPRPARAMTVALSALSLSGRLTVTRATPSRDVEQQRGVGHGSRTRVRGRRQLAPAPGRWPAAPAGADLIGSCGCPSMSALAPRYLPPHAIPRSHRVDRRRSRSASSTRRCSPARSAISISTPWTPWPRRSAHSGCAARRSSASRPRWASRWPRRARARSSAVRARRDDARRHAAHRGEPALGARPDGAAGRARRR